MIIGDFKKESEQFSLFLNQEQIVQFEKYLSLLLKWNEVMDLTAIREPEEMIEKHFLDSLFLSKVINFQNQKILDIGSGAGFPGLVLKIAYPDLKMMLLEPTQKRVNFLNAVIKELNLSDIEVVSMRAEDYIVNHREEFDIVTARAVARLNILLELSIPFLKIDGKMAILKGSNVEKELEESRTAERILHSDIEQVMPYFLSDKIKRNIVLIKKVRATDIIYPRRYGAIKKKPL